MVSKKCTIPDFQFSKNSKYNVHQNTNFQYANKPQDIVVDHSFVNSSYRSTVSMFRHYSRLALRKECHYNVAFFLVRRTYVTLGDIEVLNEILFSLPSQFKPA
jgi:hypothetical protein